MDYFPRKSLSKYLITDTIDFNKHVQDIDIFIIHILIFFLAHRAKGNVGFWHHLASLVCYLRAHVGGRFGLSLLTAYYNGEVFI
jgi:hypothetical protein